MRHQPGQPEAQGRPGSPGASPVWRIRTLAMLTRLQGAKRGANDGRSWATSGHMQPMPVPRNGTSGHAPHRRATLRKCLLSSRSRVRVAVGAHIQITRSASLLPAIGHAVMIPSGVAMPVACPMASPWTGPATPPPAWSARPQWPAAARRRRAGTPSQRARSSGPCGPSAREGWRPHPTGREQCSNPANGSGFRWSPGGIGQGW